MILCRISSRVSAEPVFVSLAHVMKLKADFLGTLYYAGTKKTVPGAFNEPALAEAVARLIGNCEVPGIEVASASA